MDSLVLIPSRVANRILDPNLIRHSPDWAGQEAQKECDQLASVFEKDGIAESKQQANGGRARARLAKVRQCRIVYFHVFYLIVSRCVVSRDNTCML